MGTRLIIALIAIYGVGYVLPRPSKMLALFERFGAGDYFVPALIVFWTLWLMSWLLYVII